MSAFGHLAYTDKEYNEDREYYSEEEEFDDNDLQNSESFGSTDQAPCTTGSPGDTKTCDQGAPPVTINSVHSASPRAEISLKDVVLSLDRQLELVDLDSCPEGWVVNQSSALSNGNDCYFLADYPEAQRWFQRGIAERPTDIVLLSRSSSCYIKQRDYSNALAAAARMIELRHDHWVGFFRKGLACHRSRMYAQAAAAFAEALSRNPRHAGARRWQAISSVISNSRLAQLPIDVFFHICELLDFRDLCRMCQTCFDLREVCSDNTLWKALIIADWNGDVRHKCDSAWRTSSQWKNEYAYRFRDSRWQAAHPPVVPAKRIRSFDDEFESLCRLFPGFSVYDDGDA
eukprot:gnl/Spiro4/10337_TR5519_c0_g1_i1.p1 gnl/Spiro4/10337_TR5519_c0_g1~~gnl/Spiro4/10337_TR5519_c0_g1_i1.p1  ORF type:complete len:360 (+),score=53.46 gnl/Spiro4/10337_TR5519_c0_g1_i1:49-1080(+)